MERDAISLDRPHYSLFSWSPGGAEKRGKRKDERLFPAVGIKNIPGTAESSMSLL